MKAIANDVHPLVVLEAAPIVAFLNVAFPESLKWEDPFGYVIWYISKGYLATAWDQPGGEILACATARPVKEPGDGAVPYRFDPDGDCVFVDMLVSRDRRAFPILTAIMRIRFGNRKSIAYFRRHEQRMRVRDYRHFTQKAERVKGVLIA